MRPLLPGQYQSSSGRAFYILLHRLTGQVFYVLARLSYAIKEIILGVLIHGFGCSLRITKIVDDSAAHGCG